MPEEYEDPERSDNLNDPPSFFPYESEAPFRDTANNGEPIEVRVDGVYATEANGQVSRFVVLTDGERELPIGIAPFEAQAIASEHEGSRYDRPLTHDLMRNIMLKTGQELNRVIIDDIWNNVFYAKLYIQSNGEEIAIDARPSDAIALALRFEAPIFVAESILDMTFEE
jgi:hypothetical protein